MPPSLAWFLCALVAYLVGAIPFGLLVGRAWKGIDIREHGSGNLGATNALRVLGTKVGVLVLLLDAAKGALPVLLLPLLAARLGAPAAPGLAPAGLPVLVAGCAVVGHVAPVYLGFRGGKGVATSAGAILALHPAAFGAAFLTFAFTLALSRIVSLSSLAAALALPAAAVALDGVAVALGPEAPRTALFVLLAALVWVRHRSNVRRLLAGTEPRLGQRAAEAESSSPEP